MENGHQSDRPEKLRQNVEQLEPSSSTPREAVAEGGARSTEGEATESTEEEASRRTMRGRHRKTSERQRPATANAFNREVITTNIERPPTEFRELLLLRPYGAHFLNRENVRRGTALQNAAWPDLFAGKNMAIIGPRGYGKKFAYLPVALTSCLRNVAVILTVTDQRLADLVKLISYHQFSVDVSRPPSKILNVRKQILVCSLGWFWDKRRDFTPSIVIFDRLDLMIDFALDVSKHELRFYLFSR